MFTRQLTPLMSGYPIGKLLSARYTARIHINEFLLIIQDFKVCFSRFSDILEPYYVTLNLINFVTCGYKWNVVWTENLSKVPEN